MCKAVGPIFNTGGKSRQKMQICVSLVSVYCAGNCLHFVLHSDSSGISRIADGVSGIFSDHCYSVCSMRQPDLKYYDNRGMAPIFQNTLCNLLLQNLGMSPCG